MRLFVVLGSFLWMIFAFLQEHPSQHVLDQQQSLFLIQSSVKSSLDLNESRFKASSKQSNGFTFCQLEIAHKPTGITSRFFEIYFDDSLDFLGSYFRYIGWSKGQFLTYSLSVNKSTPLRSLRSQASLGFDPPTLELHF